MDGPVRLRRFACRLYKRSWLVSSESCLLCQALGDGGCPPGLVYAASCYDPGMAVQVSPGCTEPAPGPGCVDLPDACSGDVCICLCPPGGGVGCYVTPWYWVCSYP